MKRNLLFVFLLSTLIGFSQNRVRLDVKNDKVGYTVWDEKDSVIIHIDPIFDYISVYVETRIGDIYLGEFYYDVKSCCDTEYMEVPIDPNDPTRTRVDTIITDQKTVVPNKLLIAKKSGLWGLLNLDGSEALPFIYDSIWILTNRHAAENSPLFILIKNKRIALANQKKEMVLSSEIFQKYYPKLTLTEQEDLLNIALFNNKLIVQQGGKFVDTTFFVKARYAKIKGVKQKARLPAYYYNEFFFSGGKFNVLNLKKNHLLFGNWQNKILLRFTSKTELETPLIMDLTKRKSVMAAYKQYIEIKEKIKVDYIVEPFMNGK